MIVINKESKTIYIRNEIYAIISKFQNMWFFFI